MPQASPDYNLYVLKPDLVKEWHPTKNAGLKPQDVTPGSGKKVWWICETGHEWQATFNARLKGKGCPVCDRVQDKHIQPRGKTGTGNGSVTEWADSMLEVEPPESIFGADFRKIKRFKTKATVTVEVPATKHLFYARMKNFSHEGMCLETSTALTPGTKVQIKLDRPLSATSPESYDSVIKWCNGLTDEEGAVYNFGLGIKFI